ncbi:peptide chain release factor [Pustulibacterium marinum]|uniref:Peptide chain release factor n=1 Tax=Pustulibacterium marinum TaxID=1224947 RepID=A0A1I7FQM3_9FLAO|nr:peptide chain release factor H [Pustulibacterium marinum]SFU38507.1 peptide chain release factor [Pustulibacterium marinum]
METIIQITSGRGPSECTWVVAQVLKRFLTEAKENGIHYEVLQKEDGLENGTVASVLLHLKGDKVESFTESWLGTIQWIGQSKFRKFHKRKNLFIGIFALEKNDFDEVSEMDIKYQATRSSGAGGQHVNKVSSAVRATHLPTEITVQAMDSRSQHQNKKLARERLLLKLNEDKLKKVQEQFQQKWMNQLEIQRGNPIRVFKGSDFKKFKTDKSYKKQRQALKTRLRNDID